MASIDNTAVSRPRPADYVPGYRLERMVGRGGMGEVYRAVQLSLGRLVAVKLLAPELARDESFVARFEKEGAALAALSHPNVVSIVDKGRTETTYYLVMEFVDGPSMRELMRSPTHDQSQALRMIYDVCKAIDYAHTRGVFHRDLKPENILFDEQAGNIAKVTDFGLAGFLDGAEPAKFNVTQTHVAMGTAAYMAPEQRIDAKNADHRADVYSLGVILYELLVGEVPIGHFDPPSIKKPEIDKRLDGIVARCLKPSPADRYQKVSDLLVDLEPIMPAHFTLAPRRLSAVERARRTMLRAGRRLARAAAAVMVVASLVVLVSAYVRSHTVTMRQSPGQELLTRFGSEWPMTSAGRVDSTQETRSLRLGAGMPDTIPMMAFGRKPVLDNGIIRFPQPDTDASAGRLVFDVDFDGAGVRLTADIKVEPRRRGMLSPLRDLVLGPPQLARSSLVLVGDSGRYVALVVSEGDAPPLLEWGLGERRGLMSTPTPVPNGAATLGIEINALTGELSAWVGKGKDRRIVGDPLNFGPEWQKLFGTAPKPALGCLDGACEFRSVHYSVMTPQPMVVTDDEVGGKEPKQPRPPSRDGRPARDDKDKKDAPKVVATPTRATEKQPEHKSGTHLPMPGFLKGSDKDKSDKDKKPPPKKK